MMFKKFNHYVVLVIALLVHATASGQTTLFVSVDGDQTTEDGTSWETAYRSLQDALAHAVVLEPSEEDPVVIWVAEGTYKPHDESTTVSFELISFVTLLGGFDGTESSESVRDPKANETILSGAIGSDYDFVIDFDENGLYDFSYDHHDPFDILHSRNIVTATDNSGDPPVLDGFIVRGAWGGSFITGGAIRVENSGIIIQNCLIMENNGRIGVNIGGGSGIVFQDDSWGEIWDTEVRHNWGTTYAGGIGIRHNASGPLLIARCVLRENRGGPGGAIGSIVIPTTIVNTRIIGNHTNTGSGSAIHGGFETPLRLWNCLIADNLAFAQSAIFFERGVEPEIINCTIARNQELGGGTGVGPSSIHDGGNSGFISNSIIWDNPGNIAWDLSDVLAFHTVEYSNIELPSGVFSGTGNINDEPIFVNAVNGDYRLASGSPGIDEGNTDSLPCDDYDIAPTVAAVEDTSCDNDRKHPIDLAGQMRALGGGM